MSHATDMNTTTPMPTAGNFRLQMEGMATALLYVACFSWVHMGSGVDVATTKLLAVFFAGLLVIPVVAALPLVLLRGMLAQGLKKQPSVAAILPFANLALYALQGIAVWVVTREAYHWVFAAPVVV